MFEALMLAQNALSETLIQVFILMKILKPNDNIRPHSSHNRKGEEFNPLDRVSAEELSCGISSLSKELSKLFYSRSVRKDEVKKFIIKGEWQQEGACEQNIFSTQEWTQIEKVLGDQTRLRGMLFRTRMLAECHGTNGV